ncbi:hypothetical protein DDN55_13860, partial [Vibrio cholerae]|nr:hypothetical protein [Vibrio cholerae]
MALDVCLLDAF